MTKRIGPYEFYCLWGAVNSGGFVALDDLRKTLSGYTRLDGKTMPVNLYKQTQRKHQSIIRAANSLESKGLVNIRRDRMTPYATAPKAQAITLTRRGLDESHRWVLGDVQIISEHSPPEINIYNEMGVITDICDLRKVTTEEFLEKHGGPR